MIAVGLFQVAVALVILGMAAILITLPTERTAEPRSSVVALEAMMVFCGFAWLATGIGSIARKNWARIGSMVLSTLWLFAGLVGFVLVLLMLARMAPGHPPLARLSTEDLHTAKTATVALLLTAYVLAPGVLLIFHSRTSVRETCLAGSPPRRELRRPIAIVALVSWLAVCALGAIIGLYHPMVVLFGFLVRGAAAIPLAIANAAISAAAAWGVWRHRMEGWWAAFLFTIFWAASQSVSFARGLDIEWIAREMGYEPASTTRAFDAAAFRPAIRVGVLALSWGLVALTLYAKRHFESARPEANSPPGMP
jgi:hypothetical protein